VARPSTTDPREYRRGVVLGLTFAKVLLLLVFLLLLAAAAVHERSRRELERTRPAAEALGRAGLPLDDPAALARRLEEGERARQENPSLHEELAQLRAQLAARPPTQRRAKELAIKLERSEAARRELAETLEAVRGELADTRRELERTRPAAEALGRAGLPLDDPAALARRLQEGERARGDVRALKEQLAEREARLAAQLEARRRPDELAAKLERSEAARRELAQTLDTVRRELADTRRELEDARRELERLAASRAEAIARAADLAADLALLKAQRPDAEGAVEVGQLRRRVGELEGSLARAERERDEAEARSAPLARKVRELEARIAELEQEREALRGRLAEGGRAFDRELGRRMIAGGVYPSCWEEDGKPVYVFEIALRLEGRIVVSDLAPERFRRGEPWASVAPFRRGEPIDVGGFVAATRALADWSRRQDPPCRFWIRVRREMPGRTPVSEYLRVVGPLGSAATDHLPFYRVGG